MDSVARKFARAKWDVKPFMGKDDISADAVTGCLRTNDNKLSLWVCEEEGETVEEVVLALATAGNRLEKMHLLVLPRVDLEAIGLTLEPSDGRTHVDDLIKRHADAVQVTLRNLSQIAQLFAGRIRSGIGYHLFTRLDVRRIIDKAISARRVHLEELDEHLQNELMNPS